MKRSLFLVLILRAVLTFANLEFYSSLDPLYEENWPPLLSTEPAPVNCSSAPNGAICDCDYASLRLSCRNVTNANSVPLALENLYNLTHRHYWNELKVYCVQEFPSAYQITNQWFTGKVKFASVTFVGNCSRDNNEDYHYGGQIDDAEIRKMSIQENTLFLNWDDSEFMTYSLLFRPIQGLKSLSELTISGSRFKGNTIASQFSEICSYGCTNRNPHPLMKLTIRSCNVSLIKSDAFRNFPNLELIDLSYNQLSRLSRSVFSPTLSSLRTLKLEHNQLTSLEAGFFDGLPQLRGVNLSFNHLTMLPSFATSSGILQEFHLEENPWQCRCSMIWFLQKPTFADILADNPACASPDYVLEKPLIEGLAVVNSTSC